MRGPPVANAPSLAFPCPLRALRNRVTFAGSHPCAANALCGSYPVEPNCGCQTVAVDGNRWRPSAARRWAKNLIFFALSTVGDQQRPCLNRFDSGWRYQIRPYFTDFFRRRLIDWLTGPHAFFRAGDAPLFRTFEDLVEAIGGPRLKVAEHSVCRGPR